MGDDIKYYTPDITDLHVGYECEIMDILPIEWKKETITKYHNLEDLEKWLNKKELRTPYLTREQIEAEGWKFTATSVDLWFEKEGDDSLGFFVSKYILHCGLKEHPKGSNDCRLRVYADDCGSDYELFRGECKSINEFRKIIKWLGIE